MSRTNDLRKLIKTMITTATGIDSVYYEIADEDKTYPYIVFDVSSINLGDIFRQDYSIDIDIWDRSESAASIEDLSDSIEKAFCAVNSPQSTILPTFFLESRKTIEDNDKLLRHKVIEIVAQNYEV